MATTRTKKAGKEQEVEEEMTPEDELMVVNLKEKAKEEKFRDLEGRVVIAKIISQKNINKGGIRNSIKSLWEELQDIQMTEVTPGVFAFTFAAKEHAMDILDRRPWFVLNSLFSIQPWNFNIPYHEVNFNLTPFWVQIHGLPLSLLNEEAVRVIVERMGRILEIENPIVDGMVVRTFARARLEINIAKPLWAGSWIVVDEDTKSWVNFKYERLVGLCYGCGYLGHEQRNCKQPKVMSSYDKSKPKFGSFLAATTPKPIDWLVNENRLSGVRGQMQPPNLNKPQKPGENEAEVGESLASNDSVDENEREEVAGDRKEKGSGYNLRPRVRGQRQGKDQQGNYEVRIVGSEVQGNEDIGTSFGLKKQIGFIEMQNIEGDQHQLVLHTKTPDGQNFEMRDLVEIDTEGGKWIEIGQDGIIKDVETSSSTQNQVLIPAVEAEKLQEISYVQLSNYHGNVYYIEFPEEMDQQQQDQGELRLDGATEKELIGTWNERLSLKRERRNVVGLEAVEEELIRRKKQKREAWYDEHGKLICVTISDEFGTQTLVRNEQGKLEPNKN